MGRISRSACKRCTPVTDNKIQYKCTNVVIVSFGSLNEQSSMMTSTTILSSFLFLFQSIGNTYSAHVQSNLAFSVEQNIGLVDTACGRHSYI